MGKLMIMGAEIENFYVSYPTTIYLTGSLPVSGVG